MSFVSDKPLGFTVMGGFMFARGVGREHWDEVMKNQKTHIQKWHKLQVSIDKLLDNYVLLPVAEKLSLGVGTPLG